MMDNSLLDKICCDLWKIIDGYLFNSKTDFRSIKYVVTLKSLSDVSSDLCDIIFVLKNKRFNDVMDQNDSLHEMVGLSTISCDKCNNYIANTKYVTNYMLHRENYCELCLPNGKNWELYSIVACPLCCYPADFDNCHICHASHIKYNKIMHWTVECFIEYNICDTCIKKDYVIKATNICLSLQQ